MKAQPTLVLDRLLHLLKPLVRLAVRHGLTYPVLAAALKRVFLDAAQQELQQRRMPTTDSALSLLSGVHRRDVRTLNRRPASAAGEAPAQAAAGLPTTSALGLVAQVVAHWMNDAAYRDAQGRPRALTRSGQPGCFDELVAGISSDVRPRAVLDELLRLGVVRDTAAGLELDSGGFAPRQGFAELSALFAANLYDHAAAASANLQGEGNFLEQAVFVDEITQASAEHLHQVSAQAWQQAFARVMAEAQQRFDADATLPADQRRHRARFGVYFYREPQDSPDEAA